MFFHDISYSLYLMVLGTYIYNEKYLNSFGISLVAKDPLFYGIIIGCYGSKKLK